LKKKAFEQDKETCMLGKRTKFTLVCYPKGRTRRNNERGGGKKRAPNRPPIITPTGITKIKRRITGRRPLENKKEEEES